MKTVFLILLSVQLFAYDRVEVIMGTFATISQNKYTQEGFLLLKDIENKISSYKINSDIFKLNHHQELIPSTYTQEILALSKKYFKDTSGYFDITIGSITKNLYHFGEKERIPSNQDLNSSMIDIKGIRENHLDSNITIDLGGIGKGYAIDKLAKYFKDKNITTGRIALSGDIRCIGICDMDIQSPFGRNKIIASFKTKNPNTSISTSGTYNRFVKNKKNHHLINPKTKTQGKRFISVTLITKNNNTKIDAYATAISVMPLKVALTFLKEHKDIGYILVDSKFHIHIGNTDNLISYLLIHF